LPISLIAPDEPFDFGQVFSSRNKSAGEEVAAHLWELGHRRIAFVGGPKESIDTRERLQGLQDALARWGTRLGPRNIRYWPDYVAQGGHDYAQRWLKMTPEQAPTAIVFGNDALALGFMRSALLKGVRIPDQVSVVGFDDSPEAGLVYPGLTTARQEARALGAAACRSLLERIDVPQQRATARIEFPMSLIVRESTGRAPG
jgi:DNA-binding LacI/PurR family transcriptional regulator